MGLHTHPYTEVALVQVGVALWTIGDREVESHPGDIVVIEAGESHTFQPIGREASVVVSVHSSSRIVRCSASEGGRSSVRVRPDGRLARLSPAFRAVGARYVHLMVGAGGAALGAAGLK